MDTQIPTKFSILICLTLPYFHLNTQVPQSLPRELKMSLGMEKSRELRTKSVIALST